MRTSSGWILGIRPVRHRSRVYANIHAYDCSRSRAHTETGSGGGGRCAPVFLIAIIVVLALAAAGGAVYYFLVMRRKDDDTTPGTPA